MYRMITGVVMLTAQEWECVRQLRASATRLVNTIDREGKDLMFSGYADAKVSIERTKFVERMES